MRLAKIFLICAALLENPVYAAEPPLMGKIIGIVDGDTVDILAADSTPLRLRIMGIDAPEKSQPFGQASTQFLGNLAFQQEATAICPKKDRYGRLVCTVKINGVDVGLEQIRAGLAWHYKKYASEQEPHESEAYAKAEEIARAQHVGLWRESTPIAPWDWRHRK